MQMCEVTTETLDSLCTCVRTIGDLDETMCWDGTTKRAQLDNRHQDSCQVMRTCTKLHLAEGPLTHEPRAVTMKLWEPKQKCPKAVPTHLQTHVCGHRSSGVVWSHMWPGPQSNAISMKFYSCGSSHMIKSNKSIVVSVRSAMVSWFCVRSTFKRWFWKMNQMTMKHDPCDAM